MGDHNALPYLTTFGLTSVMGITIATVLEQHDLVVPLSYRRPNCCSLSSSRPRTSSCSSTEVSSGWRALSTGTYMQSLISRAAA